MSHRVLSLQPYFGGSHAQFHEGWVANSAHQWTTLSLPPRHWKWRMRHSAIYFAAQVKELVAEGNSWDAVVCTDMLNLAEWKGLMGKHLVNVPIVIYFHENQFAYPNRDGRHRDQHFPFTNFTSAIAADEIWFNSQFNFDSMIDGLKSQSKRWPDHEPMTQIDALAVKTRIQPPGIEAPPIDVNDYHLRRIQRATNREPIRLIWAGRWEHDKNPDDLLSALKGLDRGRVPFEISVIGQSFRFLPPVFEEIQTTFSDRIRHWGFQESRQEYWEALADSDVFVSTANHEFFGLAAAEAIAAGLQPLLPNRLAYPELLANALEKPQIANQLYDGSVDGLVNTIRQCDEQRLEGQVHFDPDSGARLLKAVGWKHRAGQLDQALATVQTR